MYSYAAHACFNGMPVEKTRSATIGFSRSTINASAPTLVSSDAHLSEIRFACHAYSCTNFSSDLPVKFVYRNLSHLVASQLAVT